MAKRDDRWLCADECATYFGLKTRKRGKPNRRRFLERIAKAPDFPEPVVQGDGVSRWHFPSVAQWAEETRSGQHQPPCYLYRHFDASGALLYVGVSVNAITRLHRHMVSSPWRHEIRTITVEYYPSPSAALEAEAAAIKAENPKHNKAGR